MIAPLPPMEGHDRVRELTSTWALAIPAGTILLIMLACAVIPLITTLPVLPDAGLALLIAWRLYRPNLLAPWAALPLGMAADIFAGQPMGISATAWPLVLLALALIEPRFPLRDTRTDWMLATAAIIVAKLVSWQLLVLAHFPLPPLPVLSGMASTILFFPLIARLAAWMERQWLAVES